MVFSRPLVLCAMIVLVSLSITLVVEDVQGRELVQSDDFTGADGDLPDTDMWERYRSDAQDSVMIMGNTLRTAVKNGGVAFARSNRSFSENNITMLVDAMIEHNLQRPIDVRILSYYNNGYQRWIAISYDPHGYGWSVNKWIDGEPEGLNSYETTGLPDVWYHINVTVIGGKFDITVSYRDSGEVVYSVHNWSVDPLRGDNKVFFGVAQGSGSWEDTICLYDNYRLYDLDLEPVVHYPPVWGPLPVLRAMEDVPLTHNFSLNVSDPDTPMTRLSISSDSEYVTSIEGLEVTFLFPEGVLEADVNLTLTDGRFTVKAVVHLIVEPVNDPPWHDIPEEWSAVEDVALTVDLAPYVFDVDNGTADLFLIVDSPFVSAQGLEIIALFPEGVLEHALYLSVSDGLEEVEAHLHFTVEPVDDPPWLDDLGTFTATEDLASTFDLSPYIHDVDTPLDELGVVVDAEDCTVRGRVLCFLFSEGGIDREVEVTVYDNHSTVRGLLLVHVQEVNDPPVVSHVPTQSFLVGASKSVDLAPYVRDEDTPLAIMVLECGHEAVEAVRGLNLTLRYDEWVPEHSVTFTVFDQTSRVEGSFRAQVTAVNQPPVIEGLDPAITMDEASERWLELRVIDEEPSRLQFSVESTWEGVEVLSNGTIHLVAGHGEIGTYEVELTVQDPFGALTSATFEVQVVNVNDPPEIIEVLSPANGSSFKRGTMVNFSVNVTDPDLPIGDILMVSWSSEGTGMLAGRQGSGVLGFDTPDIPVGKHMIHIVVSDGELEDGTWIEINIVKPPPEEPDIRATEVFWLVLIVIAILTGIAVAYIWWRQRQEDR